MRVMPKLIPKTIAIWPMAMRKKFSAAKSSRRGLTCTTAATAALTSRPMNIQKKAWVMNAWASRGSGLTIAPAVAVSRTWCEAPAVVLAVCVGVRGSVIGVGLLLPHQAGVAWIPALRQQRDLDVVLHD